MSPKVDGSVPAALPPASCQAIIYRDLPGGIPPPAGGPFWGDVCGKTLRRVPRPKGGFRHLRGVKVSWGGICIAYGPAWLIIKDGSRGLAARRSAEAVRPGGRTLRPRGLAPRPKPEAARPGGRGLRPRGLADRRDPEAARPRLTASRPHSPAKPRGCEAAPYGLTASPWGVAGTRGLEAVRRGLVASGFRRAARPQGCKARPPGLAASGFRRGARPRGRKVRPPGLAASGLRRVARPREPSLIMTHADPNAIHMPPNDTLAPPAHGGIPPRP